MDANNPLEWLDLSGPKNVNQPDPQEVADYDSGKAMYQAALAQYELDLMVQEVLTTGRGPEFLEWLERALIRQPLISGISPSEPAISMTVEQWAMFREGQNSMFHVLTAMIERAKLGAPQEPQEIEDDG